MAEIPLEHQNVAGSSAAPATSSTTNQALPDDYEAQKKAAQDYNRTSQASANLILSRIPSLATDRSQIVATDETPC